MEVDVLLEAGVAALLDLVLLAVDFFAAFVLLAAVGFAALLDFVLLAADFLAFGFAANFLAGSA